MEENIMGTDAGRREKVCYRCSDIDPIGTKFLQVGGI